MTELTLSSLSELVEADLVGDGATTITGVGDLRSAQPNDICFVGDPGLAEVAAASAAAALIVSERLTSASQPQLIVADPRLAFARIASIFHPMPRATEHRIHASAVVDPTAELEAPVAIGARAVVGAGARIGAGSVIGAGAIVGDGATVGRECVLFAHVTILERVRLGDRVIVHSGTVIGSDGFGFSMNSSPDAERRWQKQPQTGTVEIGDDVEIGANCAIDRATLGLTKIGAGTKMDNLVHVGHNCVFGVDNAIAGYCAFSGSTILGDRVTIGGHTVSGGHLRVCDDARIGGNSVLLKDVEEPGDYMGYPLQPLVQWGRSQFVAGRLVELRESVKALERRLDESEG